MNVLEAIHGRRSIRAYRDDPLPRALIGDLLWAAAQAPTPPQSGETPWAFVVVEGRQRLIEMGARALEYARQHRTASAHWDWCERPGFKVFWDAPAAVLICARQGHSETSFDCCRAGQCLLLAAYSQGVGSCWVGAPMPWLQSAGIAEEIGVPAGFLPTAAIVLGYSDETPPGHPRPRPAIVWSRDASSATPE